MFWAIHKTTNQLIHALAVEFTKEFMQEEEWYAEPTQIQECNKDIDKAKIKTVYRQQSKPIINQNGTIWTKKPHFYIPNAEKQGITTHPPNKEHEEAVEIIYSLLKKGNAKIKFSDINKPEKESIEQTIIPELFDFSKISIETNTQQGRKIRRADILLPFKQMHPICGYGIIFEIQLTEQTDKKEQERSYDRAVMGFSVCWIHKNDFLNGALIISELEFKLASQILKENYETNKDNLKELTINYTLMINKKVQELNSRYKEIFTPKFFKCPKCACPVTKKAGPYGEFYSCMDYHNCNFKMRCN